MRPPIAFALGARSCIRAVHRPGCGIHLDGRGGLRLVDSSSAWTVQTDSSVNAHEYGRAHSGIDAMGGRELTRGVDFASAGRSSCARRLHVCARWRPLGRFSCSSRRRFTRRWRWHPRRRRPRRRTFCRSGLYAADAPVEPGARQARTLEESASCRVAPRAARGPDRRAVRYPDLTNGTACLTVWRLDGSWPSAVCARTGRRSQHRHCGWRATREPLAAYFYRTADAAPKRVPSAAQLAAVAKATRTRQERAMERHGIDLHTEPSGTWLLVGITSGSSSDEHRSSRRGDPRYAGRGCCIGSHRRREQGDEIRNCCRWSRRCAAASTQFAATCGRASRSPAPSGKRPLSSSRTRHGARRVRRGDYALAGTGRASSAAALRDNRCGVRDWA